MEKNLISGLKRENFQAMVQGKETDLYTLTNAQGMEVSITNYGGSLVSIMVPDRDGNMANVIQGHDCILSFQPWWVDMVTVSVVVNLP